MGTKGFAATYLKLLGSALFVLVGAQLMLFSLLIQVLDTLDQRQDRIGADMMRAERAAAVMPIPQTQPLQTQPLMSGSQVH